jgi:alkanesulfonate monooxygenase SsuD/methylene tetrahydromethanopterin reductase-like flavin-dependent oxidoreductase (luciferase family)
MIEAGYIVLGDPDQVAERIVELTTSLNVGHLMALCQFGDMGRELTMHNTELMATKVLPQVSDLFEDQWANTWWPVSLGGAAT